MDPQTKTYDLVVIGGGPAGLVGASTASAIGKTVALIDNHHELGGAGVNTGTVPSKRCVKRPLRSPAFARAISTASTYPYAGRPR